MVEFSQLWKRFPNSWKSVTFFFSPIYGKVFPSFKWLSHMVELKELRIYGWVELPPKHKVKLTSPSHPLNRICFLSKNKAVMLCFFCGNFPVWLARVKSSFIICHPPLCIENTSKQTEWLWFTILRYLKYTGDGFENHDEWLFIVFPYIGMIINPCDLGFTHGFTLW